MANIRKSFNFRNGVQVDEDNLIVNSLGLVGIGTSLPTESLDVRGTAKVVGLMTATQINSPNAVISGVATITRLSAGNISLNSGIVTSTSVSGLVTYYGDGGKLLNLPTSQWVDVDSGFGYTSIYAAGNVGVSTNYPYSTFQVGGNPINQRGVGINSTGSINATGIITAYEFVGFGTNIEGLDGSNITTGTINVDRLPTITSDKLTSNINVSGIITASQFVGNLNSTGVSTITNLQNTQINSGIITANYFTGGLIGISSFARDLTSNANIDIYNVVTDTFTAGFATVTSRLNVTGFLGINTSTPGTTIQAINNTSDNFIQLVSSEQTGIILSKTLDEVNNASGILYGDPSSPYAYSTPKSLDIRNYDTGNVNTYLDLSSTIGVGTGNFNWFYGKSFGSPIMSLTYQGNLGIGITNPTSKLHVAGIATVSSDLFVGGNFEVSNDAIVYGNQTIGQDLTITGNLVVNGTASIELSNSVLNLTTGISTFNNIKVNGTSSFLGNASFNQSIGIGTTQPLYPLHISNGTSQVRYSTVIGSGGVGIGTFVISPGLCLDTLGTDSGASFSVLGVGTATPIAVADFSQAGVGVTNNPFFGDAAQYRFMLPPKLTTTERNNLTLIAGAIIYNITTNKHQGYNGTSWFDLY